MNTRIHRILANTAIGLCLILPGILWAQAFTPSAEQIQQARSMSPAQLQQAAESLGIDLPTRQNPGNTSRQPNLSDQSPSDADDVQDKDNDEQLDDERRGSTGLPLFGRHLFQRGQDALRPAIDIPVPADYVMGPGDTLVVQLYGKDNAVHSLVINREGQIQFPQIGPVTLAGLSFSQAQRVIGEIVSEQMIGVRVSVTMGALRSIRIFVLGEVRRPGSFSVGSLATMTNALFVSGGISEVGSLRNIELKRNGKTITRLDLYDLLLRGDTSGDARLLPGDVIFVPPIGKTVAITGEVKRPARYEIRDNTNIQELIQLAGGLQNTAHLPLSYILRYDGHGEKMLINLDLSTDKDQAFRLRDGDQLGIASKLDFVNDQITLAGHIKRAGPRSWRKGLRFTDLLPTPRDLLPNPDIDVALIQRFSPKTRRVEVMLFSPSKAWSAPGTDADPLLEGYDVVEIFDYERKRDEQLEPVVRLLDAQARFNERRKVVNVSGSVRFPGIYPLADDMTSHQLIQLAGGLTESALDTNGEITRYGIDHNRQRMVMHINVDFTDPPVELEPGDSLQVKQIPLWKQKETVQILGEVMFPGTYTILPGETLMDVLIRAGGLTPHAYPLGAIFSRQELRELEQQRLTELKGKLRSEIAAAGAAGDMVGQASVTPEEAENLLRSLETVRPLGRMVIDLPTIMEHAGQHDFQLEDGDTLTVPRYKPSVTVLGEVQYPTSHIFDASLDAASYIDRSGGFKKYADQRRVYIVKANGSVSQPQTSAWFRANRGQISPGDTIVVPVETERVDKLTVWAKTTQIIYQTALGAAAISAL